MGMPCRATAKKGKRKQHAMDWPKGCGLHEYTSHMLRCSWVHLVATALPTAQKPPLSHGSGATVPEGQLNPAGQTPEQRIEVCALAEASPKKPAAHAYG